MMLIAASIGALIWFIILFLPWRPWSTRESLDAISDLPESLCDLSDVTVLIPARNEADVIETTISSLKNQGTGLKVILIDDNSTDGTSERASHVSDIDLRILKGSSLPDGWAGKLWALEQGRKEIQTPFVLLMDADIELKPWTISSLKQVMLRHKLDFLSLMAALRMNSFWEKFLIPSFVYFFKLLYPFSLGNNPKSGVSVAAGGFILTKSKVLESIGGFSALQNALIDDCTLASKVKKNGFKTWMALTHSVLSHRNYDDLKSIWKMVARSAFTQLFYSNILLILTTLIMLTMFLGPLYLLLTSANIEWKVIGIIGILSMIKTYTPTLTYYGRSALWAFGLPLIGILYLLMTWNSALNFWFGRKAEWKGRVYAKS